MGVDLAWIDKLKVPEIRQHLEKRGVRYNKKARKSDIADILRAAVEREANQPAEAPETRCASEPPAVQAAVDVPEVAAVEAAVPSQPAAEDVQAEAQHAEAQHTYAAGVQESSKEDGAEPQSAAPTAGLQALEHEVVPQQHDGLNGAVKESDSAAAEAASAEQSHAGQPPSSAPQAASLPVQEPVVDQKEPPRAFGSAPSKDEEAAVKAGEVGGSLEGDDTAREAPADSVVLQRESVPADASAAGEREENEVQVPAEANHATPMDHDADQEVDVKPSQQAEDAGVGLADEHMEEQLDYGEEDINASQDVKPAVDAAAVAKQGSKRSREERHDDEKRHEDEKRSKGAKSDVAADVKSSLARSKGPQEVNGALGEGAAAGKEERDREARAGKEASRQRAEAAKQDSKDERKREANDKRDANDKREANEERKRDAVKERADASRQERREAEPSKKEERRREDREGRDRGREHRERVNELREMARQKRERTSEQRERGNEQRERGSEQKDKGGQPERVSEQKDKGVQRERGSEQKDRGIEQKDKAGQRERGSEQKDKAGQQKGEAAEKEKPKEEAVERKRKYSPLPAPKEEAVGRKRKYSPIPAPPPRVNKDRDRENKAAEAESDKRRRGGHEDGENGKLGRGGSAEKGRKGSVFDRLDSRHKDEKKADHEAAERKVPERGAAAKEETGRRGSGLAAAEAPAEKAVRGPGAPRSREKPSCALRIDGFVRPLHQKQVLELLSATGTVKELWMPSIKTHAFAIFESVEEAEATRQALWDVEWPEGRNNTLKPKFVSEGEAMEKIAIVTGHEGSGTEKAPLSNGVSDARELLKGRDNGHHKDDVSGKASQEPEEKVLNLDDLFRKTNALPVLYWLPLNDEQVAAKEAALANKAKAASKETAVK